VTGAGPSGLILLAVDDEGPALSELVYLLRRNNLVEQVLFAHSGDEALRTLRSRRVDGVFLDIHMPGLSGMELAGVLGQFRDPPPVAFVSAFDEHAVDAFELKAVDYVLKPIRPERLAEAVRRVAAAVAATQAQNSQARSGAQAADNETIAVELAGVTRFIARRDVRYVESHGDYARLHTAAGSHLVRMPMATLEERWAEAGFIRIHRSYLVSLGHVTEVRLAGEHGSVLLGEVELTVSRRHARALRDVLGPRRARPARVDQDRR
jgi:DNA-binding LytR/AlgR family response regulator